MRINNKGITLIALIITIIVMLILVAVSVQIVINSGLFESSKIAAQKTADAFEKEGDLGNSINIDGKTYNSVEEYVNQKPPKTITFYIDNHEFTTLEGTTWGDALNELFGDVDISSRSRNVHVGVCMLWCI